MLTWNKNLWSSISFSHAITIITTAIIDLSQAVASLLLLLCHRTENWQAKCAVFWHPATGARHLCYFARLQTTPSKRIGPDLPTRKQPTESERAIAYPWETTGWMATPSLRPTCGQQRNPRLRSGKPRLRRHPFPPSRHCTRRYLVEVVKHLVAGATR